MFLRMTRALHTPKSSFITAFWPHYYMHCILCDSSDLYPNSTVVVPSHTTWPQLLNKLQYLGQRGTVVVDATLCYYYTFPIFNPYSLLFYGHFELHFSVSSLLLRRDKTDNIFVYLKKTDFPPKKYPCVCV